MKSQAKTIEVYETGAKTEAYAMFIADPRGNNCISFSEFCSNMDKTIANRIEFVTIDGLQCEKVRG